MDSSTRHPPWPFFAGVAIATMGVGLTVGSPLSGGLALTWPLAALVAGAVLELATGLSLRRHAGAWMAQLFSGALLITAAILLFSTQIFEPNVVSTAPTALMLGIFCTANGLFRALDLIVDRPRAALSESIDIGVTLALGVLLLGNWRLATLEQIGLAAGVELLAGGFAVSASAAMAWRHPELSPYDGKEEHLAQLQHRPRG